MRVEFDCDDVELCKLILKALLDHIESKLLCKQLELSIEMAKKLRPDPDYTAKKQDKWPDTVYGKECRTCGHALHVGRECKAIDAAGDECDCS